MTFHCNRLGNLFFKRAVGEILCLYLFFAIPVVIWFLTEGLRVLQTWWVFFIILLIPTTVSLIILSGNPKEITFENKQLIWSESLRVQRTKSELCRTVVTVADLHAIEFLQNPIERLFNIGRICFMGDIRSLDAPKAVERPDIPFCFGGIRKFNHFQSCLKAQLPPSAFH